MCIYQCLFLFVSLVFHLKYRKKSQGFFIIRQTSINGWPEALCSKVLRLLSMWVVFKSKLHICMLYKERGRRRQSSKIYRSESENPPSIILWHTTSRTEPPCELFLLTLPLWSDATGGMTRSRQRSYRCCAISGRGRDHAKAHNGIQHDVIVIVVVVV